MLTVKTYQYGKIYVLEFDGRICCNNSDIFATILQHTLQDNKIHLILNMAKVPYINSAGMRTLADVLQHTRAKDGDTKLVSLDELVLHIFSLIGFERFFNVYPNLDEALTEFNV